MKKVTYRLIAIFLVLVILASVLPAAFAEEKTPAGDLLWEQIDLLRCSVQKKGSAPEIADFAAISDEVYALVEASGSAKEGSLLANGDFIRWIDEETGISCCYSPALEADRAGARAGMRSEPELLTLEDFPEVSAKRGGCAQSLNIGLIQPCWESTTNYADYSFNSYSPYYVQQTTKLAQATGGSLMRYCMENATADTIAYTLQNCGFVIFDSHGGTDYSSGDDHTSQANTSYLWLNSGTSSSINAIQELLNPEDYQTTHTGTHSTYSDVVYSGGLYGINGTVIANHMTADAPHNMLYMGICLGMATDGICAPLRAKGVEVVYGYSQSVTFEAEKYYMLSFTSSLMNDKNVAEAVATAKLDVGDCDPYEDDKPAYPIIASSEDTYPGQGNVDRKQTVCSTWRLIEPHTVTVNITNPECGSAAVDAYDITTTPISGYYPAEISITEGTGTYTVNGTHINVQCTSDITVSVTFAPKPQVTLTFSGIDCEAISGTADDVVTLPSPVSICDGYDFIGWTEEYTEPHGEEPGVKQDYLLPGTSYVLPYEDTELYALYSHIDHNGTPSADRYVLVTNERMLQEAGSYLIAVNPYYTSSAYVFNGGLEKPNVNENDKVFSFLDNNCDAIASNGATDACAVRIAPIEGTDAYSMQLQNGAGKYFGNLGTSATLSTRAKDPYPTTIDIISGNINPFVRIHNAEGSADYYFCFYVHSTTSTYTEKFSFYSKDNYFNGDGRYSVALFKKVAGVDGTLIYTGMAIDCDHAGATGISTAPTCTAAGYTTYLCPTCGYKWVVEGDPATGHNYQDNVTAPTATAQGYTTHTCSTCGDSYIDTYTDPFGIDYQVTYSILGHLREPEAVNSFLGAELPTPEICPQGYIFAGWSRTEIPNEITTAGVLTGTFKPAADTTLYAVYSRSEFVEGNGDYVKVTADPGIWNGQYLVVYEGSSLAFNGSFASTATALNKAGNYLNVTISSNRIAPSDDITAADLDAAAVTIQPIKNTTFYSVKTKTGVIIGSTGSSSGSINTSTPNNNITFNPGGIVNIANSSGTNTFHFTYNDSTTASAKRFAFWNPETKTVKSCCLYEKDNGHEVNHYTTAPNVSDCTHENSVSAVTAPTCMEVGYTTYTCTNCGKSRTGDETAALGHDFDKGVVTAPTQEDFGYTTYTCLRPGCGYSEQRDFTGIDYEITYNVVGVDRDPVTVNGYDGTVLPDTCDTVEGYDFVGWSAETIDPESTEATLLEGIYRPTEDTTLYAVYSRTEEDIIYYCTVPDCLSIRSAFLVLNGKLDLAYTALVSPNYTDIRMVFEGPNGVETVTDYEVSNGKYVFTYHGINPQCIGDSITATLYAWADEEQKYDCIEFYSVRDYCVNMLARNDISASARTLLSDTLAYGAAAQTYMNYNANMLATDGLENLTCSTFEDISGLATGFEGTADASICWISAGLTLTNSVAMSFRFYAESVDDLTVHVTINSRTQEFTFTDFTAVDGAENVYEISFAGISAEEFADAVTASFEKDGTPVGNTVSYSVNTYVQSKQADSNANLAALVQALYNYGAAAAAYIS